MLLEDLSYYQKFNQKSYKNYKYLRAEKLRIYYDIKLWPVPDPDVQGFFQTGEIEDLFKGDDQRN